MGMSVIDPDLDAMIPPALVCDNGGVVTGSPGSLRCVCPVPWSGAGVEKSPVRSMKAGCRSCILSSRKQAGKSVCMRGAEAAQFL